MSNIYIRNFIEFPLSQYSNKELLARLDQLNNIIKNSAHCDLDVRLKLVVQKELTERELKTTNDHRKNRME